MASSLTTQFEGMLITERNPEVDRFDYSTLRYKMDFKNRGVALIINNKTFTDGSPTRHGSEQDVTRMRAVLENLDFRVIIKEDNTAKQMKTLFVDTGKADHTNNSCFLAVIMSHGKEDDVIFGADGASVTITDLIECLLPDKCKSLTGKPKLFFIQSCRGTRLDKGVEVCDAVIPKKENKRKIPLWMDVLISYSNVPGYYSFLNKLKGSWYIQALADVFERYGKNEELTKLLTMVNAKVAFEYESKNTTQKEFNKRKEMPTFSSMLTGQLYF